MGDAVQETKRHMAAYLFWLGQQPRTFAAVSRRFKVSNQSIYNWARRFEWEKRASQIDERATDEVEKKLAYDESRSLQRDLKICSAVKARFATRLLSDEHRAQYNIESYNPTAQDFVRVVQLEQLLLGKATSRNEGTNGGDATLLISGILEILRKTPDRCPQCKHHLGMREKIATELKDFAKRLRAAGDEASEATAAPPEPSPESEEGELPPLAIEAPPNPKPEPAPEPPKDEPKPEKEAYPDPNE